MIRCERFLLDMHILDVTVHVGTTMRRMRTMVERALELLNAVGVVSLEVLAEVVCTVKD